MRTTNNHKVGAVNFIGTMMANVDNEKLSDGEFRQFIRNTLPIVEKPTFDSLTKDDSMKKYYHKDDL